LTPAFHLHSIFREQSFSFVRHLQLFEGICDLDGNYATEQWFSTLKALWHNNCELNYKISYAPRPSRNTATECIRNLDRLKLIQRFGFRIEPIFDTLKLVFLSDKVVKNDQKIKIPFPLTMLKAFLLLLHHRLCAF